MVVTQVVNLRTKGNGDILDVTPAVTRVVEQSGLKAGTVIVFVPGSTAAISTIEHEPGLVADLKSMWDRVAPRNMPYSHDQRWGDGNGYSHVRAALQGPSLTVPVDGGRMLLGTWQQIVLIDFDNRPRERELVVQVMGE